MSILFLESSTLAGRGVSVAAPGVLALHAGLVEGLRVVLPQALRHRGRDGRVPMNRAPTIFQPTHGCRSEVPELFAQSRLAEFATDARCLYTNAPFGILKHEPVAMQPQHHTKATTGVVHVSPAS